MFKKQASTERRSIFAALDIGNSKVCCAIARAEQPAPGLSLLNNTPSLRVMGLGFHISKGIKGSHIIDLEALEDAILNAVHSAEQQVGETLSHVYVNLPSGSTQSHMLRREMPLSGSSVEAHHLKRLLSLHKDPALMSDHHIVHVLPISYELDGVKGIRDPRGMVGDHLAVVLHVITVPVGLVKNLMTCIGRCHLDVKGFVVSPYASALSVINEDEMELGVTVVDMGGGHTTMASFIGGNLVHMTTLSLGGNIITQDIARGLGTSLSHAERLKTLYGKVFNGVNEDQEPLMNDPSFHPQAPIMRSMLTHIIRARVEEIFEMLQKRMHQKGVDPLVYQKFVLTGGSCQIQGLCDFAQQTWNRPTRIGTPHSLWGHEDVVSTPGFATCAGLLHYSRQDSITPARPGVTNSIWDKAGQWFRKHF